MATLDPSHNIFRQPSGKHAQAVHRADDIPPEQAAADVPPDDGPSGDHGHDLAHEESESDDDDLSSVDDRLPPTSLRRQRQQHDREMRRAKMEARRRVRGVMPPMPDLRFEQSYLVSIRPFLAPRPNPSTIAEKGPVASSSTLQNEKDAPSTSLVKSSDEDEVFHWGRKVNVNWSMVIYVTLRDQVLSPLIQGALWGWGTLFLVSTGAALRASLYPASHVPSYRTQTTGVDPIRSGLMGDISDNAGKRGEDAGWWRRFVKSWGGGVETAAA